MSDRYKGAILSGTAPTVTLQSAGGEYTLSQQMQYQGQGVWPTAAQNPITQSLRIRSSANAYLSRTPSSAGNQKTWTYSVWLKKTQDISSPNQDLLSAGRPNNPWTSIYLSGGDGVASANTISIATTAGVSPGTTTTAVFRDPSAWYHIVIAMDTTQATASNRVKLWVNNALQAFSYTNYPSQNSDTYINSTTSHSIGALSNGGGGNNLDAYLAEANLIDGVALTPSSFGTTDVNGIWQPIPYTGSYGTNGYYLPFSDIALTSGSNAGLGKDFSGNGNYWNTNNISVTSGSTYDAMLDSPSNASPTIGNYCTWNAADPSLMTSGTRTISNANLTVVDNSSSYGLAARGTIWVSSGKWYWEITCTNIGSIYGNLGFCNATNTGIFYQSNGYRNTTADSGSGAAYGASYTTNDIIGVALDLDSNQVTFYKNNSSQGAISISSGTYTPAVGDNGSASTYTWDLNCGQQPFVYTPPTGFNRLNTYNLPVPTIPAGNKFMDATLYTGNGTAVTVTNAGTFQPDLVWGKSRSNAISNYLVDSVRGVSKALSSDRTDAEDNAPGYYVTAFNSNGFTVGLGTGLNTNGATYVGWQWQAGQGVTSSNTNGSITSTVSVNPTAGFSVVTYTGTGAAATVGHGLGVKPSMIFLKCRTVGHDWRAFHGSFTSGDSYLRLNTTAATASSSTIWNGTLPTSSVFSVGTDGGTNQSGQTFVAYCWSEIAGFSKFGSYTGNGSADGTFVYMGFRPKYIMTKKSSGTEDWAIIDTSRSTYNIQGADLYADLAIAEGTSGYDILSNGIKFRSSGGSWNASGATYIYMAFAENPFKMARAR